MGVPKGSEKKLFFGESKAFGGSLPCTGTQGFPSTSEPICTECVDPRETGASTRTEERTVRETFRALRTEERSIRETGGSPRTEERRSRETFRAVCTEGTELRETGEAPGTGERHPPPTREPSSTECLSIRETGERPRTQCAEARECGRTVCPESDSALEVRAEITSARATC